MKDTAWPYLFQAKQDTMSLRHCSTLRMDERHPVQRDPCMPNHSEQLAQEGHSPHRGARVQQDHRGRGGLPHLQDREPRGGLHTRSGVCRGRFLCLVEASPSGKGTCRVLFALPVSARNIWEKAVRVNPSKVPKASVDEGFGLETPISPSVLGAFCAHAV